MIRDRLALLLALLLLGSASGVQYVNDELLWTKQPWNQSPEYKLAFPWHHFAKRETAVSRLLESEDWVKTSLDGPLGDIREEIEKDIKRCGLPGRLPQQWCKESRALPYSTRRLAVHLHFRPRH
jgi:hypothetical protein